MTELTTAGDGAAPARRPRPWVAVVLSIVPGLGHLYAGCPRAALGWLVGLPIANALALLALEYLRGGRATAAAVAAAFLSAHVWLPVSAWRAARTPSADQRTLRGRRLAIASAAFVALSMVVQFAVARPLSLSIGSAFKIPSGSMEPTIMLGDYVTSVPVRAGDVRPGRMVIYHFDGTNSYLKRVAGVAGDTLAMHDGTLVRNGATVREPYAHLDPHATDVASSDFAWQRAYLVTARDSASYRSSSRTWGPLVVPRDKLFILGDNRDRSADSRYIGFVDVGAVYARPTRVYFSYDVDSMQIRWNRIGLWVADD